MTHSSRIIHSVHCKRELKFVPSGATDTVHEQTLLDGDVRVCVNPTTLEVVDCEQCVLVFLSWLSCFTGDVFVAQPHELCEVLCPGRINFSLGYFSCALFLWSTGCLFAFQKSLAFVFLLFSKYLHLFLSCMFSISSLTSLFFLSSFSLVILPCWFSLCLWLPGGHLFSNFSV